MFYYQLTAAAINAWPPTTLLHAQGQGNAPSCQGTKSMIAKHLSWILFIFSALSIHTSPGSSTLPQFSRALHGNCSRAVDTPRAPRHWISLYLEHWTRSQPQPQQQPPSSGPTSHPCSTHNPLSIPPDSTASQFSLEPGDGVLARPLEDVAPVHRAIVVHQHHIALLHRHIHLTPTHTLTRRHRTSG